METLYKNKFLRSPCSVAFIAIDWLLRCIYPDPDPDPESCWLAVVVTRIENAEETVCNKAAETALRLLRRQSATKLLKQH